MLNPNATSPIQIAWTEFVDCSIELMGPQENDRPLDQYLVLRDKILILVNGEEFLSELNESWNSLQNVKRSIDEQYNVTNSNYLVDVAETLLLELQAFAKSAEVFKEIEANKDKEKKKEMALKDA